MDALGTARLTEEIPAQRTVAAMIRREEIVGVLDDPEAQPELILRILLGDDEAHTISMDWSRDDLEELLLHASGDAISLRFDRDELSGAFDDVEAHGIRERALVFTVAAAAALGAGTGAQAMLPAADGAVSGGAAAQMASSPAAGLGGSLSSLARSEQMSEGFLPASAGGTPSGASEQFLGIDTSGLTDAILVGGVLLTLTGATFAARHAGTARPT
jgi:hypothetical protein